MRTAILGTGSYVPEKVLTNHDLEKMVDTSDEWIRERTGIRQRRIAADNEATSDLALKASLKALEAAEVKPEELDLIILASVSGDRPLPSTACILQDKLGATNAAAFDILAACSGFIYLLTVADAMVKTGRYKRALIVGAEVLSRFTDWHDRTTCVLLGDGAGAAVLGPTEEDRGIIDVNIFSDGSMWDLLHIPAGGSVRPATEETVRNREHFIKMRGNETFKVAVRTLEKLVVDTLEKNNLPPEQLSLLIPHQANHRIIKATAERLGLSMDRVMLNIDKYGNTSAASIPIAMDEAVRSGRIKRGDYILLEAFGGGLTWGSA
ncbi:MAG: ketoacyl-ACP synthase III, partial [Nitrospirae bacterium]